MLLFVSGCVYLPPPGQGTASTALAPDPGAPLAAAISFDSGVDSRGVLLQDPEDALRARLHLLDNATRSMDLQYFIIENDATALLFAERLLEAADRGVRVRMLVDDFTTSGLVDRLQALDDHPNIEIRVFNPFNLRVKLPIGLIRYAEMVVDGDRLNHRMHNKLFVADNLMAILGGRNIGDEYFGLGEDRYFLDTDILLMGTIVPPLSEGFDSYWNGRWAYPVTALPDFSLFPSSLETVREQIARRLDQSTDIAPYRKKTEPGEILNWIRDATSIDMSEVVLDDPDVRMLERADEIAQELAEVASRTRHEALVVTPYLVPTKKMFEVASALRSKGTRIRVLTNSIATNDVSLAHAVYSNYRSAIVDLGVELYELRSDAKVAATLPEHSLTLHSKFIVFDDDLVFIGSLNLDPRSLYRNTEVGVLLRSRQLAGQLRSAFADLVHPENAWQVTRTEEGLVWQSAAGTLREEPAEGTWQRVWNWILSLFPLHGQT